MNLETLIRPTAANGPLRLALGPSRHATADAINKIGDVVTRELAAVEIKDELAAVVFDECYAAGRI